MDVVWGKSKTGPELAPREVGTESSADELLECVVNELAAGRARSEITHELVKHGWERKAASDFCQLAQDIAKEVRSAPDQRAACARRGMERIQASYGWIGSGLIIGLMMYFSNKALQPYAPWSLAVVAYGLIELFTGLTLWWPHKDFLTDSATGLTGRNPSSTTKPR